MKNTTVCTFCDVRSDDISTGSDGKTLACADCLGGVS